MEENNDATVTEFLLLGFAGQHKSWRVLFTILLMIYMATLVGNIGMILLIKIDSSFTPPCTFSSKTWLLLISATPLLSLQKCCKAL